MAAFALVTESEPEYTTYFWNAPRGIIYLLPGLPILAAAMIAGLRSVLKFIATRYAKPAVRFRSDANDVAFLLLASMLIWPWPLHLRFQMSRPALQSAARAAQATGSCTDAQWIGLYRVRGVYVHNRGQVFFDTALSGDGWLPLECRSGILFEPTVSPEWWSPVRTRTLAKSWSVAYMTR